MSRFRALDFALIVVVSVAATRTADVAARPDTPAADATQGTGFAVPRHVIAGGGGTSAGGPYAISGTVGQADADPLQPSTGGSYAITGGFWPGTGASRPDAVFANGFEPTLP